MKNRDEHQRKAYAMQRMNLAIDRVILAKEDSGKDRAARWVAAWGMVGSIRQWQSAS